VWEVEGTDAFVAWFETLGRDDKIRVEATIEHLERLGPGLGRRGPTAFGARGSRS